MANRNSAGQQPATSNKNIGQRSITHDDNGQVLNPITKSDWDGWVAATDTRNFMLQNPLLDWLDRYGIAKGFKPDTPDPRTDHVSFLSDKGRQFKQAVVKHLQNHLQNQGIGTVQTVTGTKQRLDVHNLQAATNTYQAMCAGVAVIYRGVLRDPQHRCYGSPELLIRRNVLESLFGDTLCELEAATPAPNLDIADHYVVVDIKYTTLDLTVDGSLSSSKNNPAYKAQLHIYNRALGRLQGFTPSQAFLLGRGWEQTIQKHTTRAASAVDRLGPVPSNDKIRKQPVGALVDAAVGWLLEMRGQGATWNIVPPTVDKLRPNMNTDNGRWTTVTKGFAARTGELTMLPNVSVPQRKKATASGAGAELGVPAGLG